MALPRATQAQEVFDQFFRYTETAHKTFIDGVGDESIDPFSGNLHIVQTDLVLPGKAGLDLRIVRSYSSKLWERTDTGTFLGESDPPLLGWGWSLHMGRLKNPTASGGPTSPCSGDYPVMELPDGSARVFYRVDPSDPTVYASRDFWRMETNCSFLGGSGKGTCVWSTDGVRYEFSSTSANQFYYGDGTLGWPLSQMVDKFGNTIAVTYEAGNQGAVSKITDTYGREVLFSYTGTQYAKRLDTMTAGTRVYQYGYTSYSTPIVGGSRKFLTSVVPPAGPPFLYDYQSSGGAAANQYALTSIQYPYGGTVSYAYTAASFYAGVGVSVPFAVVQSRTVSGPGTTSGTWTYSYTAGKTGMNKTTIVRPDGRGGTTTDSYTMYGFGSVTPGNYWKVGLTQEVSLASGAEVETSTWQVSASAVANSLYSAPGYAVCAGATPPVDSTVRVPILAKRVIKRDVGTFTTTYSSWDAYGQPKTVTENGPKANGGTTSRTTNLTYFSAPTDDAGQTLNLVKGLVLTKRTCISSDCVNDAWTYGGPDHALDSETRSGIRTEYAYHLADPEGRGNLKQVTNALNQDLTLTEYSQGRGTPRRIDFNGAYRFTRTTSWEGWVLTQTDGRNNTVTTDYDAIGRAKRITPPGSNDRTDFTYDQVTSSGVNVVTTRGPYTLTTTYDGFGRTIATVDSVGVRTSQKYDELGRLWYRSYPYASSLVGEKLDLDSLGRVTTSTKACGAVSSPASACSGADRSTVTTSYGTGNCATTVEQRIPDSLTTVRCYDSYGSPGEASLAYMQDAAGSVWKYAFTTAGGLKSVTAPDAKGNRTYVHDTTQLAFLTGETAAELGKISGDSVSLRYQPNAIGQVRTRKDARGVTWTYAYSDPLSRLTELAFSGGTSGTGDDVSRSYEAGSNNLESLSSSNGGAYSFTRYDELNRLRAQTWTFQGRSYATQYTYDSSGCLTRVEYPTGTVVTQRCDDAGRVKSVTLNGTSLVSSVNYHPSGQPTLIDFATGPSTTLTYDDRARLETLETPGVLDLTYTYDGVDNVTSFVNAVVPGSALRMCSTASGTCRDGYDALNRLVAVIAPGRWGSAVYDYDVLGNRRFKSADQPSSVSETYNYGTSNRLDSVAGTETFTPMTFKWDDAGRLAWSSDGTSYAYDGLGRRVSKAEPGQTTIYHYDSAGRVLAETTADGQRLRDYVYLGGKLIAVEGCLSAGATPPCSERQRYHTDVLGSVLAKTDLNGGNPTWLEYQPFGEQWSPPANAGDRQYNGRVFDSGTGFHDYGARMYWPQIGRFISADSYLGEPANPASLNWYSYVHNNPYRYTDPTGHWGAEVHRDMTTQWASAVGFLPDDAAAIGMADNGTDQGGTGPLPWQDQSRHFDTNEGNGIDTRLQRFQEDFDAAVMFEKASRAGTDPDLSAQNHALALQLLGQALHSLQDIDAHCAPYVRHNPIFGYFEHASPENPTHRGRNEADDPRVRPERIQHTGSVTKAAMERFREESAPVPAR